MSRCVVSRHQPRLRTVDQLVPGAVRLHRLPSAKANWNHAVAIGAAHRDLNAPRGAVVFWDIAAPHGHVGVSRGDGTFVATSVNGAIGSARLPYFANYLGWSYPVFW